MLSSCCVNVFCLGCVVANYSCCNVLNVVVLKLFILLQVKTFYQITRGLTWIISGILGNTKSVF